MSGAGGYISVPEFHPTMEEFANFEEYVRSSVFPRATHAGLAKVVAPPEWRPTRSGTYPDDLDFLIETPIMQHINGAKGVYQHMSVERESLRFKQFRQIAQQQSTSAECGDFEPAPELDENEKQDPFDAWEFRFWRNIRFRPPMYGADTPGSLFEDDAPDVPNPWNLAHLQSLLTRKLNRPLPGVNTSYLYVGMWKSCFAWHTEDMDLAAINYLHFGAPKAWYGIPVSQRTKFEEVARLQFPEHFKSCPEFLRHKQTLIAPSVLKKHGVTLCRVLQEPRQFIITLPGAYHSGFNTGFNLAEATNFATAEWIPLGLRAKFCHCRPDSVRIDMSLFVSPSEQNNETNCSNNGSKSEGNDETPQSSSGSAPPSTMGKAHPSIPITIRARINPAASPSPIHSPEEAEENEKEKSATRPRITVSVPSTSHTTGEKDEDFEAVVSEFAAGKADGDFLYYTAVSNSNGASRKRTRHDSDADSDYEQDNASDDPDFVQGRQRRPQRQQGGQDSSGASKQPKKAKAKSKPKASTTKVAKSPPARKSPAVQQIVVPTTIFISPSSSVTVEKKVTIPTPIVPHKKSSSTEAHRHPLFKKRFGSK